MTTRKSTSRKAKPSRSDTPFIPGADAVQTAACYCRDSMNQLEICIAALKDDKSELALPIRERLICVRDDLDVAREMLIGTERAAQP